MIRLSSLDYLRGICALGILLFHYSLWTIGVELSSNIFTRIGIYGVPIFYILSGITLYHVYSKIPKLNISNLKLFYVKRLLRIFPLLWLATWLKILFAWQWPDTELLITNLSGAIAFYNWDKTLAFGAWSIGNELVYYLFFPVLLYLTNRSKLSFYIALAVLFAIYITFSFYILDRNITFIEQWKTYTHPLNHAFFFGCGVWIGFKFKDFDVSQRLLRVILLLSLILFIFYPVSGERIELITGTNRLVFTVISISICFVFYKIKFDAPRFIDSSLSKLGHGSYSLYLLHPIMYKMGIRLSILWQETFFRIPHIIVLVLSAGISIILSYAIFYYFESYFTKKERQFRVFKLLEKIVTRKKTDLRENTWQHSK